MYLFSYTQRSLLSVLPSISYNVYLATSSWKYFETIHNTVYIKHQ